jgi:hypothetical protein
VAFFFFIFEPVILAWQNRMERMASQLPMK